MPPPPLRRSARWAVGVVGSMGSATIALGLVLERTDGERLPNGTWLRRQHVLAPERDVVLWDGAGRRLVEDPIDLMCHDDDSVYGWTMAGHIFLHRRGWSEAMPGGDPGFDEALERSGLRTGPDGCGTVRRPMLGPLLIMHPHRHRHAPGPWTAVRSGGRPHPCRPGVVMPRAAPRWPPTDPPVPPPTRRRPRPPEVGRSEIRLSSRPRCAGPGQAG